MRGGSKSRTLSWGGVAEWSKAADCKSVRLISRWFESNLSQLVGRVLLKNNHQLNKFSIIDKLSTKKKVVNVSASVVSSALMHWSSNYSRNIGNWLASRIG